MFTTQEIIHVLSEATALRLYNSAVNANESNNGTAFVRRQSIQAMQQNSLHSVGSVGTLCRICRWNRSDMEIVKCPCLCKGSVGFIHLPCLKRWIMHRRSNNCEICNAYFNLPEEKLSIARMFKTFFTRCAGPILKHLLFGASLIPLNHVILQQVVIWMENINLTADQDLTIKQVIVAVAALMTSSALLFHFIEFIATRIILIRNIFRHWWAFGNSSDFALIQIESDILDLLN